VAGMDRRPASRAEERINQRGTSIRPIRLASKWILTVQSGGLTLATFGIGLLQDSAEVIESALSYLHKTQPPREEKIVYGQFRIGVVSL
jgi:hypothetical protein